MTTKKPEICVLGAGVVGLSAVERILQEHGKDAVNITVIAEEFLMQTTSCGSGGLVEPYQILGTPDELVNEWCLGAFHYFLDLYYSPDAAKAGVQLMNAYNLQTEADLSTMDIPAWKDVVLHFKVIEGEELRQLRLPSRFVRAFGFTTLVVDQKYYLQYLMDRLRVNNVTFIQRRLETINELDASNIFDVIINCCGLGSAALLKDLEMYPIRGQVLRVKAPWMKNIWFWGKSYIIPNIDTVVLGGTADKGEWSTVPSIAETRRILDDIGELFPALAQAPLENVWVGLRPGRTTLRLEVEHRDNNKKAPLIHCYGHGGSGITLAMGCANEIVAKHLPAVLPSLLPSSHTR